MKVLIVTGLFPPEIGGPATYSRLLLEELPKYGLEVDVLPFKEVRHLPLILRHLIFIVKIVKKGRKADLLYAQDPVSVGLPTLLASFFLRRSYFLKIVGDYAWEQGTQRFGVRDRLDDFSLRSGYSWPVKILKFIQKIVALGAIRVIVPSYYLKKIVSNWGVPSDKIKVIYNSFNAPKELASKNELRDRLDFSGPTMVTVGRLVPWKGFILLIELMPELVRDFPDLKLFIVGEGPDRSKLEAKIKDLSLGSSVILTGQLDRTVVLEYLKASDLFVLNTAYEGFSHQLLEVMWVGTPLITTRVGGNPELVKDGVDGFLVENNNREEIKTKIMEVLKNKNLAESLSVAAKNKILGYTKERMIRELIEELNSF